MIVTGGDVIFYDSIRSKALRTSSVSAGFAVIDVGFEFLPTSLHKRSRFHLRGGECEPMKQTF